MYRKSYQENKLTIAYISTSYSGLNDGIMFGSSNSLMATCLEDSHTPWVECGHDKGWTNAGSLEEKPCLIFSVVVVCVASLSGP